ncbi:Dbl homology domain-containing protein [Neoconidiobolus thromboides FSU 785]|nr:Dbl homology domain-containing protein [Neoconidiobolus thromboides FSU 785]
MGEVDDNESIMELDTYIDLSDNNLREVPPINGVVTHLRLDSNEIDNLFKFKMDDFTSLTVLDLSYNKLEEFSSTFSKLTQLKELYLNHNYLTDIPSSIAHLKNLEILDVSYNKIVKISAQGVVKLVNLHHLNLRYNLLEELPYSLGVLESRLFTLLVDNNPYNSHFINLIGTLLQENQQLSLPKTNRWSRLRSAMRRSISLDNEDADYFLDPEIQMSKQRSLMNLREEKRMHEKFKKLALKKEDGDEQPKIPAKNPRRFVKSSSTMGDSLVERQAFDNRRCQTLDGFVFMAESEPNSPSFGVEEIESTPRTPTSLRKLGFSNLVEVESTPSLPTRRRSQSKSSINTNSSNASTHLKESKNLPPLPFSPPYQENHENWPPISVGANQLPSHSKLIDFFRQLRDIWDLSPASSESKEVGIHRRKVKDLSLIKGSDGNGSGDDTDLTPAPKLDGDKASQEQRRRNIMQEILTTEETYVHSLKALIEIYIEGAEREKIFTAEENRILFSNVKSILLFHQSHLLPEIKKEVLTPDSGKIGGVFKKLSVYLKMYSLYVNDFDQANIEAEKLNLILHNQNGMMDKMGVGAQSRQRRRIKNYLEQCSQHPKHNQLNLQGFLLLPVQRIPRYKMLLYDLLKYTPLDDPDRQDLIDAHSDIAKRAQEINERKRVKEANDKVIEIQNSIKGNHKVPLVEPHRRFIKEGFLYLSRIVSMKQGHSQPQLNTLDVRVHFKYFLFNDIMIQCKRIGKELELHRILELGTKLKPARLISGKSLRVVDNHTIYYFSGETEELASWAAAINSR